MWFPHKMSVTLYLSGWWGCDMKDAWIKGYYNLDNHRSPNIWCLGHKPEEMEEVFCG